MSDLDMQGIADRLFGGPSTPATPAATETPAAIADTPPAATADAAEAARAAQLKRGAEISARAAAKKADAARKASFEEHGLWKPQDEAPAQLHELPDAIRELRDSPERRMFSAQGTYATFELGDNPLAPEIARAVTSELREIFSDVGASTAEAQEFATLAKEVPAAPEARASLRAEAIEAVRQQYREDADAALADARALVARDPRVAKIIDATGLGDHPRAVLTIIQLARAARMRGEL